MTKNYHIPYYEYNRKNEKKRATIKTKGYRSSSRLHFYTKHLHTLMLRFSQSSFFHLSFLLKLPQVAAVVLWISRGYFIVQTIWVSYRISVGYRKFIIFKCSVYGYCKDDKTVCSMGGDSSRDINLFTKYKISIFSLFFSPIPRKTTHKSLKRQLLHPSSFCDAPWLPSLIHGTEKN